MFRQKRLRQELTRLQLPTPKSKYCECFKSSPKYRGALLYFQICIKIYEHFINILSVL